MLGALGRRAKSFQFPLRCFLQAVHVHEAVVMPVPRSALGNRRHLVCNTGPRRRRSKNSLATKGRRRNGVRDGGTTTSARAEGECGYVATNIENAAH
jgi:hypothetical protein